MLVPLSVWLVLVEVRFAAAVLVLPLGPLVAAELELGPGLAFVSVQRSHQELQTSQMEPTMQQKQQAH